MQQIIWLVLGMSALGFAWLGPVPRLSHEAFFGHMVMHMLNVAVAAPFLSLAIAASKWDPANRFPKLFAPITASVAELIVVWAWHAPAAHHFARHTTIGVCAEQSMFLLAGIWVWLSAFGGQRTGRNQPIPAEFTTEDENPPNQNLVSEQLGSRTGAGIVGLLMTSMHMTLLGALLALSPRLLYQRHHSLAGMTALEDQQLGGAVMIVAGGIAYTTGGLFLAFRLLKEKRVT
jgi:putative membrane protein